MKSYSKLQNYLSLFMFITINILFYFKLIEDIYRMRSYYERVIYTFHHFLVQIQTDFRSQTCQRRYNHFYNSYFITSFLYSQRNIHGRQMDYYRSFLGLRFKRPVPLCRKNFYRQLPGGNAVLFSSLLSILLHTRNRIHNRYFHCSAGIPFQT